jgi:hypothetical protein
LPQKRRGLAVAVENEAGDAPRFVALTVHRRRRQHVRRRIARWLQGHSWKSCPSPLLIFGAPAGVAVLLLLALALTPGLFWGWRFQNRRRLLPGVDPNSEHAEVRPCQVVQLFEIDVAHDIPRW